MFAIPQYRGFAKDMPKVKELNIGLFGLTGSGKTAYLSMLVYDINTSRSEEV